MPFVHFIKKARVSNPVCDRGGSYYWWKHRGDEERTYSLEKPRVSELTQSSGLKAIYEVMEELEDFAIIEPNKKELRKKLRELSMKMSDLARENYAKVTNMPPNLKGGKNWELMYGRAEACTKLANDYFDLANELKLPTVLKDEAYVTRALSLRYQGKDKLWK